MYAENRLRNNSFSPDDAYGNVRVLHVINGEHYAGAERVQDLLAANLPTFGFDVVFAALKPNQFPIRRRCKSVPLYDVPMRSRFDLRPARALVQLALRERCQLIHTHTVRAALVGRIAASISGLPMVHHLHSPTTAETTRSIRNRLNALVERMSVCNIAGAVAVSHSLARYGAEHGIPRDRIDVVHNGVPVHANFGLRKTPDATWTLGCMALFRPRKGLETMLAALRILRKAGHSVRLRAVGAFETGEYEREVHEAVERLGVSDLVDWRGFRSDIASEFAAMDLFVLPSLFGEGLPMVMLEAMSYGVPIVGSRVEGVPDAVVDGDSGLLVEPGNPEALAAAIRRCLTGEVDWQSLRRQARRRQVEQFSDQSMTAGTAELYRRVLGHVPLDSALHSVADDTALELIEA